jgi:ribosomal protein L37E
MECKVCGRWSANEDANFCDYCGASFRESQEYSYTKIAQEKKHMEGTLYSGQERSNSQGAGRQNFLDSLFGGRDSTGNEKPMTFMNWLMMFAMIFLPYVGLLLFLALMVYWAVGRGVTATKKNFARAALLFCIVLFFFYLAVMSVFFASMDNPEEWLQNLLNMAKAS